MIEIVLSDVPVGEEFAIARTLRKKALALANETKRRWRARHRAQGKCRDCPRDALPGSHRCRYHLDKNAADCRNHRARRR